MVADNRALDAEQVVDRVRAYSPALASCLRIDRRWVWYCGPSLQGEPGAKARDKMKELGFRFAKSPHKFSDGTVDERARWFHPCGGAVFRRRRPAEPERAGISALVALFDEEGA